MTIEYIEFLELCAGRYSCRNFCKKRVSQDLILEVLETARLAPSACNRQPWTFYVVRDPERRSRMLAKSRPAFLDAPVLIVAVGHHDEAWHRPSDDKDHTNVDLSIAVEHICLAAAANGLGTCWVCSFDIDAVKSELQLDDNLEPIALIPLGYPKGADKIPSKVRKMRDEIIKWVD